MTENNKITPLTKTIDLLVGLQSTTSFDFSVCYPYQLFNQNEIKREFYSFRKKYVALYKNTLVPDDYFDNDISRLAEIISEIPQSEYVFMHRDFQPRNILVHNNELVLIDFQGGRCGPKYYDLVSFIYSPDSSFAYEQKEKLLGYYVEKTGEQKEGVTKYFYIFALLRLIHILGVYVSLGLEQEKEFFKKKIPTAEKYLQEVLGILENDYNIYMGKI